MEDVFEEPDTFKFLPDDNVSKPPVPWVKWLWSTTFREVKTECVCVCVFLLSPQLISESKTPSFDALRVCSACNG